MTEFPEVVLQPADSHVVRPIELGHIGLDVQQGRTVDDVHVLDVENVLLDPQQANDRDPDRAGPLGAPRRKDPTLPVVEKGFHPQCRRFGPVEMVNQDHVREAVEVL